MSQIKELYDKMKELDVLADYEEILEEYLGEGVKVSDTSTKQIQPLICIREALQEVIEEVENEMNEE